MVIMAAGRVVDQGLAARADAALQELQLSDEGRMVQQVDAPLGEEGLDLGILGALVQGQPRITSSTTRRSPWRLGMTT